MVGRGRGGAAVPCERKAAPVGEPLRRSGRRAPEFGPPSGWRDPSVGGTHERRKRTGGLMIMVDRIMRKEKKTKNITNNDRSIIRERSRERKQVGG